MSPVLASVGALAGLGVFPGGNFESIATVSVGSGGASSIDFTSIPSGYQHLQVRGIYRNTSTNGSSRTAKLTMNGDTANNYTYHQMYGDGSTAAADSAAPFGSIYWGTMSISTDTVSTFSATVVDILDYSTTSKNKTVRAFSGRDHNGSGLVILNSGLWMSTSAVTSLRLEPIGNSFAQYSQFSLYGVRA